MNKSHRIRIIFVLLGAFGQLFEVAKYLEYECSINRSVHEQ